MYNFYFNLVLVLNTWVDCCKNLILVFEEVIVAEVVPPPPPVLSGFYQLAWR